MIRFLNLLLNFHVVSMLYFHGSYCIAKRLQKGCGCFYSCCQENCFFVNRMASQIGRNGAGICSLFLIETVAMGMLSIPLHVFSPFLWYL